MVLIFINLKGHVLLWYFLCKLIDCEIDYKIELLNYRYTNPRNQIGSEQHTLIYISVETLCVFNSHLWQVDGQPLKV